MLRYGVRSDGNLNVTYLIEFNQFIEFGENFIIIESSSFNRFSDAVEFRQYKFLFHCAILHNLEE